MKIISFLQDILTASKPKTREEGRYQDIVHLQELIGHDFPIDYFRFLLDGQVSITKQNTSDVVSRNDESKVLYNFVVTRFIGLNQSSINDLKNTWIKFQKQIPKLSVPIAYDRFRNLMILSLSDGCVYFADFHDVVHDKEQVVDKIELTPEAAIELAATREVRIYWVANSFSQFFDNLYSQSPFS